MEVTFFPRKDYDVEVCNHRYGKAMTYTDQTDSLQLAISYTPYMTLAKSKGVKVGCFAYISDFGSVSFQNAKQDYENGKLWLDLYSYCSSLQYKIEHHETITEQEFEGAYTNELFPAYLAAIGKKPVCLSYAYGNDSFKDYVIPKFLGARNSEPDPNYSSNTYPTDYGIGLGNPNNEPWSVSRYKSKASSMRWYDAAKSKGNKFSEELEIVSQKIDETAQNHGWLNNFTHWHNYWQDGNEEWAESYLTLLAQKKSQKDIYFAGYGEAVAYLVYRSMISKAVMYSPNGAENDKLIIRLEAKNIFNIDTDLLQVPISIKFSTTGTPLAGQTIRCNYNLASLGNNQYIVEIPYSEYAGAVIEKVSV